MDNGQIKREEIYYRQLMLYYEVYNLRSRKSVQQVNPWHWHDEFEVCLIKDGVIKYRTAMKEYLLTKGDVVFINAKTLHEVEPVPPCDDLNMSVHFFDDAFISGGRGNYIDVKYVYPVQNNDNLDMIVYKAGTEQARIAEALIDENILLKRNKSKFWEFELRKNICQLWEMIIETTEELKTDMTIPPGANSQLRDAISYLQANYKKKVTLNDIADNVHISTRGCDRMFKKYLNISPIMYLHSIRLQKATSMLADMSKTISEVAMENGYASSSHFGKIFKEEHNMTPKEYRDRLYPGGI